MNYNFFLKVYLVKIEHDVNFADILEAFVQSFNKHWKKYFESNVRFSLFRKLITVIH